MSRILVLVLLFFSSCSIPYGEYHMYNPGDSLTKEHVSLYIFSNNRFILESNKFYTYGDYIIKGNEICIIGDSIPYPKIVESFTKKTNKKVIIKVTENGNYNSVCWLKDENGLIVQQTDDNGIIKILRPKKQSYFLCSCFIGDSISIVLSPDKYSPNYYQINLNNDSIKSFKAISPMKLKINNDSLIVVSSDMFTNEKFIKFSKNRKFY